MKLDKVLQRQLKKLNLDSVPKTESEWGQFLEVISQTYEENEKNRVLNEGTIEQALKEMERLNQLIQKQASEQIQSTEEKLHQVMESVPSLVLWIDQDLKIKGANKAVRNLLNQSNSKEFEIEKHFIDEMSLLGIKEVVIEFFAEAISKLEWDTILEEDGTKKYYKLFFNKFSDNEMAVIVGVDLTADVLKKQELESAQATSIASARMALLGEMASGIAHEINNPLAIINSIVFQMQKLIERNELVSFPDKLAKIQKTVMRITKIISGLRTFARDGQHDPFEEVLLKDIIDDTLELAKERLKNLDIELKLAEVPADLKIKCRATQISQVVLNLVSNARDAIQKLDERWIKIDYKISAGKIQLIVEDSGNGISPEIQEKIFQPFFTTKEVGVGTGLGLSISTGIIKSHGGVLYINNNSTHTQFVIELPYSDILNKNVLVA